MSDRLQDLLRQRALIHEQLAWLDREIAAATDAPHPAAVAPTPRATVSPAPVVTQSGYLAAQAAAIARHAVAAPASADPVNPAAAAAADAILEKYRVAPDSLKTDVRKGCFLYFAAALALVALVVVGLYYALSGRTPAP